jgi:hypothetical protein
MRIADLTQRIGFDVEFEKAVGDGGRVGLRATWNSETIAIEVETGEADFADLEEGARWRAASRPLPPSRAPRGDRGAFA